MTTYKNKESYQWNFINSSSQPLSITLSPSVLENLTAGFSPNNTVSASIYGSVLSYQECSASFSSSSITPVASYIYDGNTPISLGANSTLILYGYDKDSGAFSIGDDAVVEDQPTILVNGQSALFTYSASDYLSKQYVNIEGQNGFTVTENTSTQNNVTGNGVEIQNGGAGGPLNTNNMCFQISDLGGTLLGTGKADNLRGSSLNNIITTYGGADRIAGLAGIDYIVSGKGSDSIYGGDDNDILIAQGGRDILDGGLGDDFLDGGIGRDRLTGGLGADKFAFTSRPRKGGADKIVDFTTHEADTIWVSKDAFGIAADARLTIEVINRPRELAEALASENLFVLDSSSGNLYFNSNGVNGGAGGNGGLFAVLMNYQESEEAFGIESILLA